MRLNVLKFTDKYIFVILSILLGLFTFRKKIPLNPKNILIIKVWAIGDSVNALPLIKNLKEKYPNTKIIVFTKKPLNTIYNQPFIDEIITSENIFKTLSTFKKYDLVFDLEPFLNLSALFSLYAGKYRIGFSNQPRSNIYHEKILFSKDKHIVHTYLSMGKNLKITQKAKKLIDIKYSKKTNSKILRLFKEHNLKNKKIIGIFSGAGDFIKERSWPINNFKELCDTLTKNNKKVVLLGAKDDIQINEYIKNKNPKIINLSGIFNLEELSCIISKLDILVSNDTGPMHIGAAQEIKTIGLFGPNTPKIWGPYGKQNISLFHPKNGCPYIDNTKHSLVPKHLTTDQITCMESIPVEEVLKHIK